MSLRKKIVGVTLAGTLFTTSLLGTGEFNLAKAADGFILPAQTISSKSISDIYTGDLVLKIDGKDYKDAPTYLKDGSTVMLPLRMISEALGYEVKWNDENKVVELTRGPHWITVKTGQDYYTFGKMAPMELGTASVVNQGVTFVPLDFVTKILKAHVSKDIGVIEITTEKPIGEQSILNIQGQITEISETEQTVMLLVNGEQNNESIVLKVYEDTKIINPLTDGRISVDDLKEGDIIRGFYSPMLTKSIPPQANAQKIEVLKDIALTTGKVIEINKDDEHSYIFIGDFPDGIKLYISEETKIVTEDDKELNFHDLQEGIEVDAFYGPVMTMSLPPISQARKVVVK